MLPIFGFLFFKFNIWTNFWNNSEKPHLVDYLFFGVILLFLYVSFNHADITITSVHGKILLDMTYREMSILDFYDYNKGTAVYLLPQYILFAIWSIPVKIGYLLAGIPPIDVNEFRQIKGITLWWYKLLPTLFYLGSAFMIYKITVLMQIDKNKAKWMPVIFISFPMASFSQFIFGQYDSVGVFFELLMINFFLQKKIMKAALICAVAVTFKIFPIFIFLPILLLFEKKVIKIFGYSLIAFSGYIIFTRLFSGSETFKISTEFNDVMLNRLFTVGIGTPFGNIAFFLMGLFIACIFAYFTRLDGKDEFSTHKYVLYIPLFVYSIFFSFVPYHPQWILVLTPYLVLNIIVNRNTKGLMYTAMGTNIGYLLTTMSLWNKNVDANLVNLGIFPQIFGSLNKGEDFRSLNTLVRFGEKIPNTPYLTLFIAMLIVNLILSFPQRKNILASRNVLKTPFHVERDVVWINGMIILLFAVPSILLFFAQPKKMSFENRIIISELTIPMDVEILKQNAYGIDYVDIINDNIVLKCGTDDPYIYLSLQNALKKPDGLPFIELTYTNTEAGPLLIFLDFNDGLKIENILSHNLSANDVEKTIYLPIERWNKSESIVCIRLDPPDGTEFTIKSINLVSRLE
jgi:hypothetical protein